MNIIVKNPGKFENLIKEVLGETTAVWGEGGMSITLASCNDGLHIFSDGENAVVSFSSTISLFRAIGIIISKGETPYEVSEKLKYNLLGNMVDCSRNAVMNLETVKKFCRISALLGFNMLQLYTEDTYEIEGEVYFGHLRGRYTLQELQEIDRYADSLGIEVIPCIQTLAHLNCIFKWNKYATIRDLEDILNVGTEGAIELIEKMFQTMRKAFKSNRINIGMDEAQLLGAGQYLELFGYKKRSEIMKDHLKKVVEICHKYNYEPMMWSDMFFRMCSPTRSYTGVTGLPDEVINSVPEGVNLVYWNYFNNDPEVYKTMIEEHLRFNRKVSFAGGASTWQGFAAVQKNAIDNSRAALSALEGYDIDTVLCTEWGDDGAECSTFSGLPTIVMFAEAGWNGDLSDDGMRTKMAVFGADFDDFYNMYKLFTTPEGKRTWGYIQKYLLYGDVLQGAWDYHVPIDAKEHFMGCIKDFEKAVENNPKWSHLFKSLIKLSEILALKSSLGIELKEAYDNGDKDAMNNIANSIIPEIVVKIKEFKVLFRERWMKENKAFGFEVQDTRLGGLSARLETVSDMINDYLSGKLDRLEELEAPRLSHIYEEDELKGGITTCSQWHRAFTQGVPSHCII